VVSLLVGAFLFMGVLKSHEHDNGEPDHANDSQEDLYRNEFRPKSRARISQHRDGFQLR